MTGQIIQMVGPGICLNSFAPLALPLALAKGEDAYLISLMTFSSFPFPISVEAEKKIKASLIRRKEML